MVKQLWRSISRIICVAIAGIMILTNGIGILDAFSERVFASEQPLIFEQGIEKMIEMNESSELIRTEDFVKELKETKKIIENKDSYSLNSITVDNDNGTNTLYIFNQDLNYVDADGSVEEKDLALVATNDKQKIKDGYVLEVKSNDIASYYPMNFNKRGIIAENLELIPYNSASVLSEIDNDTALYKDVFDGIDMEVEAGYQGFFANIQSENIASLNNVVFQTNDDAITRMNMENDSVEVQIGSSTYQILSSDIMNSEGEVIGATDISLDENNNIVLSTSVDEGVDENEAVTTSISVTINKNYIQSVTVFQNEDIEYVDDGYNYIGTIYPYGTARTFIKFDLSALEGIPYDSILSAYYKTVADSNDNNSLAELYMVTSDWSCPLNSFNDLPNVDYNNKIFSLKMGMTGENYLNKYFYITSAIQAWLQGYENNGLMIKSSNDYGWAKFYSPTNETNSPYLSVIYSNDFEADHSKGVNRGELYYILNRATKEAVGVYTDPPPSDIIPLDFSMSDMEGWQFVYDSTEDGIDYFRIRHYVSIGFFEAVWLDAQGEYDIYSAKPSNEDSQKWRIIRNWNGSYKIIPKNSNGTKALGIIVNENGENEIALVPLTVDSDETDDWTLLPINKGNATLYGTCSVCWNLNSQVEITNVEQSLTSNGFNCINLHNCINSTTRVETEMAYRYLEKMFDTDIWYFSTHGVKSRMHFKEGAPLLQISDIGVSTTSYQDNDEFDNETINVYGINDYEGDFNKLQFAFMNSCETGANNGNESLVGTMYNRGAHCIMAHTESIGKPMWEAWQEYFNICFNISDVNNAITFADRMAVGYDGDAASSKHILGNTSYFYNYEANASAATNASTYLIELSNDNDKIPELKNNETISESNILFSEYTETDTSEEASDTVDYNELNYAYDSKGSIRGYSKYYQENLGYDIQLLYSYNDKENRLGNNPVNSTNAVLLARSFIIEDMDIFLGPEFVIKITPNDYANEFIYDCINKDAESGDIRSIIVYVEEDENDVPYVTFYKAEFAK